MVYVRKALRRLEHECQEIIEESRHDWFFKDVNIKGVEKCIPNFSKVRFDHSGQPMPELASSVKKTLDGLEKKAQEFRKTVASGRHSSGFLPQKQADVPPQVPRNWMMHDCTSQENLGHLKGDKLVRIDAKQQVLEYFAEINEEQHMLKGVFMSARSLKHLKTLTWSAHMLKHKAVVLGFVTNDSFQIETGDGGSYRDGGEHKECKESYKEKKASMKSNSEDTPEPGKAPLSLGYRCFDGKLLVHDGDGTTEIQGLIPHNRTIEVTVEDTMDGDCKIRFTQESDGKILAETRFPLRSKKLMPVVELHVQKIGGDYEGSSVRLSFEPMVGSVTDSLNEMFHVLFNAIQRHYLHLHGHANLTAASLLILSDAIERGEDAANHEVNAQHAIDLLEEVQRQSLTRNDSQQSGVLDFIKHGKQVSAPWRAHIKERFERWHDQVDRAPKLKSQNTRVTLLQVEEFEPLVVEYLTLENFLASESFWDNFTHRWLRQFGYTRLRNKVEALWAFIEVHEKVLTEIPALTYGDQRFPGLLKRIQQVCEEGKSDMSILETSHPRRFFYAKHFLACRFMASIKLRKLEQYAAEGWLPSKDLELLELALHRTLRDLQRFHPRYDVLDFARQVVHIKQPQADYQTKVEDEDVVPAVLDFDDDPVDRTASVKMSPSPG
jgi:hypothetical protein